MVGATRIELATSRPPAVRATTAPSPDNSGHYTTDCAHEVWYIRGMKKFMQKHERLLLILAPTLLGVLYIALCAINLRQSVWFDESYSAYLTRFSFGEIWELARVDVHPPLFYFLLKIWGELFGNTDFGLRFMSVFFGAIAVVFAWQWLKRVFGTKAALLGTLLLTISPMFIRYGQEMRMYTLAAAIVFGATYVLQLAMDTKKRKYWIIYGILIALGMWTHYFTALIWLTHLIYLIYVYRKKILQKEVLLGYAAAVVAYLPWLPGFMHQVAVVQGGFWVGQPNVVTITDTYTNALVYLDSSEIVNWVLVLTAAAMAGVIFLAMKGSKKMTLLKAMAFLPPILLILLSMPPLKPIFLDRYLFYSVMCLALVVGVSTVTTKFKTKVVPIVLAILFVGTSAVGLVNLYRLGNYNKVTKNQSDVKTLFEHIVESSEVGVPIISCDEWKYYDMAFYETEDYPVYFLDEQVDYIWGSHEPLVQAKSGKILELDAFLEEHETVWYACDLPAKGNLEFPREGLHMTQSLVVEVGVNQRPYQAIQMSRVDVGYTLEYKL